MSLYTDSFTRANSNTIGGAWVQSVSEAGSVSIASNQLRFSTNPDGATPRAGAAYYNDDMAQSHSSRLTFKSILSQSLAFRHGVAVRVQSSGFAYDNFSGYVAFYHYQRGPSHVRLYKFNGQNLLSDAGTLLGEYDLTNRNADGLIEADANLTLSVNASNLTVTLGLDTIVAASDGDLQTGFPGVAFTDFDA